MDQVILMCGPAGSGKSTYARGLEARGYVRVSFDGEAWHGPSLHEALDGCTADEARAHPVAGAHSVWELVRHVTAWADEMLCADDTCAGGTRIHLLGGFLGTADIFDHLTGALGIEASAVHTPERFGLAAAR